MFASATYLVDVYDRDKQVLKRGLAAYIDSPAQQLTDRPGGQAETADSVGLICQQYSPVSELTQGFARVTDLVTLEVRDYDISRVTSVSAMGLMRLSLDELEVSPL